MKTVDLTKVDLNPKALMWTTAAFTAIIILYSVATFGAGKVKDLISGATRGMTDKTEESF